jgi:H+/Cl- antiporter ClcA
MFVNAPENPSQLKKAAYLCAATILGILLSFIAHAIIEIVYLHRAESQGKVVTFYGSCALPPVLQILLLALGAIGGFLLGRFWWRKVYIERVWARKYQRRKSSFAKASEDK